MILIELWIVAAVWTFYGAKGWREYVVGCLPLPVCLVGVELEARFDSLNGMLIAYAVHIAGLWLLVWVGGRFHSRRMSERIAAA